MPLLPQVPLIRFLSFGAFLVVSWLTVPVVLGQTTDSSGDATATAEEDAERNQGRETVDVEPYTGPPIFLFEGEAPPPPSEVESRVVKENYDGSEARRFERRLILFSDDSVYSDGPHKEFYPNGQLFVDGKFTKSRATGKWSFYHPDGKIAKEVTYVNGHPDGEVQIFGKEGQLIAERSYKKGVRDGVWAFYDKEGKQKLREESYRDGKPDGVWKIWYSNGQLRQLVHFVQGQQEGLATEWTQTGEKRGEAMFIAGKRDGKTTLWQRDGKVVERMYKAGQLVE